MPLTKDFRETVMTRVKSDPAFRDELIVEATNAFLKGDMETGKALLRDYLNNQQSATCNQARDRLLVMGIAPVSEFPDDLRT
jgi:hypothetical protein